MDGRTDGYAVIIYRARTASRGKNIFFFSIVLAVETFWPNIAEARRLDA